MTYVSQLLVVAVDWIVVVIEAVVVEMAVVTVCHVLCFLRYHEQMVVQLPELLLEPLVEPMPLVPVISINQLIVFANKQINLQE